MLSIRFMFLGFWLLPAFASAQVLSGDFIQLEEGTENRDDPFIQFTANGGTTNSYIWSQLTGAGGRMVFAHNNNEFMEVEPDARDASIWLDQLGVGLGTRSPSELLHVEADGLTFPDAKILVENSHVAVANRSLLELKNNGPVEMLISNDVFSAGDPGNRWAIRTNTSNELAIGLAGYDGGVIYLRGDFRVLSDRHAKEEFSALDAGELLDKVIDLPITSWKFKTETDGARHIGPTAQDFNATFGLGGSDKAIAPVDAMGIALVAIKGLNDEIEQRDARIGELEASLDDLAKRLSHLEALRE